MPDAPLVVACLCAAWCRTCDAYAPVLSQVAASLTEEGAALRVTWIDIEDQADLVGDIDVQTFPTLLVADARHVRFAGPVTPEAATMQRLLRALVVEAADDARWPPVPAEYEALAQRLRQHAPGG